MKAACAVALLGRTICRSDLVVVACDPFYVRAPCVKQNKTEQGTRIIQRSRGTWTDYVALPRGSGHPGFVTARLTLFLKH